MTEEQRRFMLHYHLLVWVYGYNDFSSFRVLIYGQDSRKIQRVDSLSRASYLQSSSQALHGHGDTESSASAAECGAEPAAESAVEHAAESPPEHAAEQTESEQLQDPLVIDVRQRIAQAPHPACSPRFNVPRCLVQD